MVESTMSKALPKSIPNLSESRLKKIKRAAINTFCQSRRKKLGTKLVELGFRRVKCQKENVAAREIYIHDGWSLVVKENYLTSAGRSGKVPKRAVPTIFIDHDGFSLRDPLHSLCIQPLVDTTSQQAIAFQEKFQYGEIWDDNLYGEDAHPGNVGIWNGAPAVFDW